MLHLKTQYIAIIKKILKKNIPDKQVLAFGSRVKGNYKEHSDIDLCIMGEKPLSLNEWSHLREDFSNSDLPIRVDIVDWTTITPEFQEIIKANSFLLQ